MAKKQIVHDLSKWNEVRNNYDLIAKQCDGVIIRIGNRLSTTGEIILDPKFPTHYQELKKLNCPIGVYFFTTAINEKEAREEAQWVLNRLEEYQVRLSFPIAVDVEHAKANKTGRSDRLSKDKRTDYVIAFLEECRANGYEAMIYSSDDWFVNSLDRNRIKEYKKWNARYGNAPSRNRDNLVGWQYTQDYRISGLSIPLDASEWYDTISESASRYTNRKPIVAEKKEIKVLELKAEPLYGSSTSIKASRFITGTYYQWSEDEKNGRIRITNKLDNVGKAGQVTGWILAPAK